METALTCADCGTSIDPSALTCPSCHSLTQAPRLEALASEAKAADTRGDLKLARGYWRQAIELLPVQTVQYESVQSRIADLDKRIADAESQGQSIWKKAAAGIGPGVVLLLTKGKFLLLGLTKLSTLLSMFAFFGVYWAIYGWAFALGLVLSIYVHEMGHVMELRHYGIPASAPMFIPGLGAIVRLKQLHLPRIQDSRIGLAGPIYGLGAALVSLGMFYLTQAGIWGAIAHFGAFINLFNLIPVWQLDGSRGFASLTRVQRGMVVATAFVLWMVSFEGILFLIALAGGVRLFTKDASSEPDAKGTVQFVILLIALTAVASLGNVTAR